MNERTLITLALFLIGLLFSVEKIGGIVSLSTEGFSVTSEAGIALIIVGAHYYHTKRRRKTRCY